MPERNILVIAVDGLRAAALGAYGNTSFATPALDQLATESLLFDWCFADAVELPAIYRSLWHSATPLLRKLAERGYSTTLVTDESAILAAVQAADFHECVELSVTEAERAGDVSETALARLFAAASDQVEQETAGGPRLVWVHSRGMYGPWDAPLELQEELLAREEGDPPPADVLSPPDLWLDDRSDPDAAFRWSCAYAAQVMTLDACVAGLCRTVEERSSGQWLVIFLGVRGFPLGEHGRVGGVDGRLFAEQLHVPLVWRFPDGKGRLARKANLVSVCDVPAALLSSLEGEMPVVERDTVLATGPAGERSLRTADWSLHWEPAATDELNPDESPCRLFVRPDDRWEANNVAALCPDIVESLLARFRAGVTP
jgi:arylsulfatase A-like enzyme